MQGISVVVEDVMKDDVGRMQKRADQDIRWLARHLRLDPTPPQLALTIERASFKKLRSQEETEGFKEKSETAERFFREGRAGQ